MLTAGSSSIRFRLSPHVSAGVARMLELWNCKLTAGVTACVFCDAFVFFPLGHDLDRWSVEPHVKQRPQSLSACPVL